MPCPSLPGNVGGGSDDSCRGVQPARPHHERNLGGQHVPENPARDPRDRSHEHRDEVGDPGLQGDLYPRDGEDRDAKQLERVSNYLKSIKIW